MAKNTGASAEFLEFKKKSLRKGFHVSKRAIIWIVCIIVGIALIVAGFFGVKYLSSSKNGSIRRNPFNNALVVGDNWIISCPDEEAKLFYKMGETYPITGFELQDVLYATNKEKPIYRYVPQNPEAEDITSYMVTTATKSYAEMPEQGYASIRDQMAPMELSDIKTDTVDGMDITYFYYMVANSSQDGESVESYTSSMTVFLNVGGDGPCTYFQILDNQPQQEGIASERELFNYVDNIIKKLQFD